MTRVPSPRRRLEHDDRVIDQHPDAEREPAQRHDVERNPGHEEWSERGHHAHADHAPGHERGQRVAQEEVQHEDREDAAEHGGVSDFLDRALDEAALVREHLERDPVLERDREVLQCAGGDAAATTPAARMWASVRSAYGSVRGMFLLE